jgi:hypothetical protein
MDWRVTPVTCKSTEPDTDPIDAVIVVLPTVSVVARPELLMVATFPAEEVQMALLVMSWVLASLKVPLAVNCCREPTGSDRLTGATVMDRITAEVTVTTVLPVMEPETADMVVVPVVRVVANPVLSTVAIARSDEFHTASEMFWVLPSVNSPSAVNCAVFPMAKDGTEGLTDIETRAAGSTVNVVVPVTAAEVALSVTLPALRVVATPVLSTETTLTSEEAQVTETKIWVLPSLKSPLATKACVSPCGTDALSGVIKIEVNVAAVTVRPVDPAIAPRLALMVAAPVTTVVAMPLLLIEATEVLDEVHVTWPVRSCALPSLKVPVATNCCVVSTVTDGAAGVTAIEIRIGLIVKVFDPVTPPVVAEMVVVPLAIPVARPETIEATFAELDDHVARLVRSLLLPSL